MAGGGGDYARKRIIYQDKAGSYHVAAADTGTIALLPLLTGKFASDNYQIQQIHVEVSTSAAQTWSFQDSTGTPVPIVPVVSTASIAHFDFDFGPEGVPCGAGTAFNLVISGANAVGWVSWLAFQKPAAVVAA